MSDSLKSRVKCLHAKTSYQVHEPSSNWMFGNDGNSYDNNDNNVSSQNTTDDFMAVVQNVVGKKIIMTV